MSVKYHNIPVKPETYEKLKKLGYVGDSFDSVIEKLLEGNRTKENDK